MESVNGWSEFILEGEQYFKTAANGSEKRKNVFTPEIIYNIIAMSIEKYIMGYLLYFNQLPDNHTLADLIDALKKICDVDLNLYDRVVRMNQFQEICCLSTYKRKIPDQDDISEFLDINREIRSLVTQAVKIPSNISA